MEEGSKKYILNSFFFRNFVPHDRELYALDSFPTLCAGFRRIYPQNPGCQKFGISKKSEILAKNDSSAAKNFVCRRDLGRMRHIEVRDLWPESIVAADMGGESSTTVKILGKIAALLYRKAAHIVVVSPAFKEVLIRDWHVSPQRISVVSNGVDTNLFKPIPSDKNGQTGKFVVSYIGTLGAAHGLSTVVEAARLLSNADANVQFLIVGEGAEKVDLMQLVKSYNIENIQFISQQPRSKIPGFICESDVCLVPLKNSAIFKTVIPTKMLEFMACGRPVILGVEGQAKEILEKANAGLAVAPENPEHLVKAIERLRSDENLRDSLGNNGVEYVFNNFSRESTSVSYLELLENILSCKML